MAGWKGAYSGREDSSLLGVVVFTVDSSYSLWLTEVGLVGSQSRAN